MWIIAVSILVYLAIGYFITYKSTVVGNIHGPLDFWIVTLGWFPTFIVYGMAWLIKGILYAPKRLAEWHINKFDRPTPRPKTAIRPPQRP